MTGFGRSTRTSDDGAVELACELRSVNQRGLDVKLRLPRELSPFEPRVLSRVRHRFDRGRIDVAVTRKAEASARGGLSVDVGAARRLVESLRAFADDEGLTAELRASDLLLRQELFVVEEVPEDDEATWSLLEAALDGAMDDLEESRRREGEGLLKDFQGRLERCASLVDEVRERAADTPARIRDRLSQRLAELELGNVDPDRLAQEVALLAERADVSEELARLAVHLEHFEKLAESDASVGRKLDFLCQELNREANTVGSKCSDAPTAHLVVELKAEIERIREQVQNVE